MKQNMIYAILGIKVRNAMWNASFEKTHKQNSLGEMYASPQALGFAIKEQMHRDDMPVLYRKKINKEGVMDLKNVFESLTGKTAKELKTENSIKEVLFKNFIDVVCFGTTFTAKGYASFGICGAVQIGMGYNKYKDTEELISEMMPCFSADSDKKAKKEKNDEEESLKSNTLGSQYLLDKAQFTYDITINPFQYKDMIGVIPSFNGFTEEHYQIFKNASLKAVSNLNSKSKKGCTNDFAVFVETKDEIRDSIDLNCLSEYVNIDIVDDKVIYDITALANLLEDVKEDLKSVEVYYDERNIELKGKIEGASYSNIKTRKEIK